MKTIYLLRHATAEAGKADAPDNKRGLTKAGRKEAQRMAKEFASKVMLPELIISSSAKRAVETAQLFAKELGYKKKNLLRTDVLYGSSHEPFLDVVRQLDDKIDSVMLVGHNPTFNQFAGALLKRFNENIPKCGMVGIKVNYRNWKTLQRSRGEQIYYNYPDLKQEKAKKYKEHRDALEGKITTAIATVLKRTNAEITGKMDRSIRKSSGEIAKKFVKRLKDHDINVPASRKRTPRAKTTAKAPTSAGRAAIAKRTTGSTRRTTAPKAPTKK